MKHGNRESTVDAPRKKRVVFVHTSLEHGGTERVLIRLANNLDPRRWACEVVLTREAGALHTELLPHIPVTVLGYSRLRNALPAIFLHLYRTRPAYLFSSILRMNLALIVLRIFLPGVPKLLIRESTTFAFSRTPLDWPPQPTLWIRRLLYPFAEIVLAPHEQMAEELEHKARVHKSAVHIFPNPISMEDIRTKAQPLRRSKGKEARFVVVGRLSAEKGIDALIEFWAHDRPPGRVDVIGEGPQRPILEQRIRAHGLEECFVLRGAMSEPWSLCAGADALLMSSRFEGMPNVALEALACGTPVIATPTTNGLSTLKHELPPGALYIADLGTDFLEAMRSVAHNDPPQLRPSLLPARFDAVNVGRYFTELLESL